MPPAARRRRGQPISTAFVEGTVNEIVAKRTSKAQQVRWSRVTAQPFLGVRAAVLNDTLEDAFRRRHPGFRPAQGKRVMAEAARSPPTTLDALAGVRATWLASWQGARRSRSTRDRRTRRRGAASSCPNAHCAHYRRQRTEVTRCAFWSSARRAASGERS